VNVGGIAGSAIAEQMMTEPNKKARAKRLPRFRSYEEEAEFWDTHDSTEYEHLFRSTRLRFAETIEHVLMVTLDGAVLDRLIATAQSRNEGPTALAARLIAEGLDQLSPSSQGSTTKKGKRHG
jgi:hypothetical protein